ncbi:MAG: hypothetical protein EZS26_001998 [Candidatus Ordinivivax streblomastigis]|uniref:HTH LytTR-type domain-containing protein n=1 Tax=Candidatus Ordinivivax streblomastigis TaxID=2540710 RepID=A0A5M8P076_9BACT|nr:MAG: hypothetical protein EZS26_001998 [Candidatus Ordinivivax streblomastigis]
MNNPFFATQRLRLLYSGIWVILTIIQILFLQYFALVLPGKIFLADVLVGNILQAISLLVLWYPVKYYRNVVHIPLFIVFHILLLSLSYALWLGMGFFIVHGFASNPAVYVAYFFKILPVKICFGFFIYLLFVLIYYLFLTVSRIKMQEATLEKSAILVHQPDIEKLTRISVKKNQEIRFVAVEQILYIEANGDYVLIHTADNKYLKDKTMKYWETHLPGHLFVRIHRSFIINIETIAKIELYEKDSYNIQMKNGHSLKASNAGYKLLRQKM